MDVLDFEEALEQVRQVQDVHFPGQPELLLERFELNLVLLLVRLALPLNNLFKLALLALDLVQLHCRPSDRHENQENGKLEIRHSRFQREIHDGQFGSLSSILSTLVAWTPAIRPRMTNS